MGAALALLFAIWRSRTAFSSFCIFSRSSAAMGGLLFGCGGSKMLAWALASVNDEAAVARSHPPNERPDSSSVIAAKGAILAFVQGSLDGIFDALKRVQ